MILVSNSLKWNSAENITLIIVKRALELIYLKIVFINIWTTTKYLAL